LASRPRYRNASACAHRRSRPPAALSCGRLVGVERSHHAVAHSGDLRPKPRGVKCSPSADRKGLCCCAPTEGLSCVRGSKP
jgi:hypothetical protein